MHKFIKEMRIFLKNTVRSATVFPAIFSAMTEESKLATGSFLT